jgi:signal transduction histidine kinase/ActR/RegA family two-component response regulator
VILKKPFDTVEAFQLAHAFTEKWWLHQQSRRRMDELEIMVAARTHELQAANEQLKIEMAERAQTEEVLRQAQKMEAVGQLAGGIAHDFNNLLTVIRGYVQCLILEMPRSEDVSEALREIDVAAERAAKLTSQMLMFSRKKRMQPQALDLNEVITQLGTMLRRLLGENISLDIQASAAPLTVHADPVMIEMVILNLAMNARDAMPDGGRLLIHTAEIEIKLDDHRLNVLVRPGPFACLSVTDNGSGIAPEVLPHLFEPFFTTKEVGKGTGLGLASVYGIVKQHAGWVEVESEPHCGATFKIFLPVSSRKNGPAKSLPVKTQVAGGSETILLVEDEPSLRRLARAVLERAGYNVLEAGSGVEALSVWAEHGSKINLLLTDMIMPGGLSGGELAEQLREKKSDLKIIYTSGYSPEAISRKLTLKEGRNFLAKPYHPDKLTTIIRQCLDESLPAQSPAV